MKRLLLSITAVVALLSANAQITVNANVPVYGDTMLQTVDSLYDAGITTGSAGANQTWDFSLLQVDEVDTIIFLNPDSAMGSSNFPTANMAVEVEDSTFAFGIFTTSAYELIGFHTPQVTVPINGGQSIARFPIVYNDSWNEISSSEFGFPIDGMPGVDSISAHQATAIDASIDAYGTVELPMGNFAVLRVNVIEIQYDTTFIYDDTLGWWIDSSSFDSDTSYKFEWWTNAANIKFPVAEVNYDPADFSPKGEFRYINLAPAPPVGIAETEAIVPSVYPNPATDVVFLTNGNSVEVYDITGKLMLQKTLGVYDFVDTGELENGIYLFSVKDMSGEVIRTEKITIAK